MCSVRKFDFECSHDLEYSVLEFCDECWIHIQ